MRMVHLPIPIFIIMARRNEQPACENCSNRMRSVFCDLHGNELESLNESKGCGDYKKGQIIFNAGAYPHGLFCVNEGKIKIYRVGDEGKEQIIFIENHDIDRFASMETNFERQKSAAAIMLLIGGVPSIYYGQEIGMEGKAYSFGNTDGNDIGRREAFDWYQGGEGKGMAFWYKNSGAWWTSANQKANDGISLEEQQNDSNSLYQFYKKTIELKQSHSALAIGTYQNAPNNNPNVLSFYRVNQDQKVLVVFNLSDEKQAVRLEDNIHRAKSLLAKKDKFDKELTLIPYQFTVWKVMD